MPNWVCNKVHIGNSQAIKDCISIDEDGDKFFDFDKIVKMPKELENTQVTIRPFGENVTKNWYFWRLENWGTKWNSQRTKIIDNQHILFETAWSMPHEIFLALSKKYQTRVEVEYADEDLGYNCGTRIYDNGKLVEDTIGDLEFAERIWNDRH